MQENSRLHSLQTHLSLSLPLTVSNPTEFFSKITLNRPSSLNALNLPMIIDLLSLCDIWNKSKTKIVWFCGKGGKAFCAGGDIKSLSEAKFLPEAEKQKFHDKFIRQEYTCDYKLACMKPLQISVFDGIVMGGGAGISIYSKIKIATETTVFAMPEAKIGFFTDVSAFYFLGRLPNNLGMFLALTGTSLRGAEMVQAGLANFFLRTTNLDKLERYLLENVDNGTSEEKIFEIVSRYSEKITGEYQLTQQVRELFDGESLRDIYEKLRIDKKYTNFSRNMLKLMDQSSPTSLRVIFEGIRKGKNLSLAEDFNMEFRLTKRFFNDKDFYEGVRCTLVDKRDKPKWKYANPFEMPEEEVVRYFSRLPEHLELNLK